MRAAQIETVERPLGSETLAEMRCAYPGVRFTWLMGADNLAQFHLWRDWRWIMNNFPIGVLGRPGAMAKAGIAPAARRYRKFRLPKSQATKLAMARAPAWTLLTTGRMSNASSTAIRAAGGWV